MKNGQQAMSFEGEKEMGESRGRGFKSLYIDVGGVAYHVCEKNGRIVVRNI